jgi:DNA mismatch repair ATPase MutS
LCVPPPRQVKNAHMGCIVEGEGEAQRVTFLYTLQDGPCPKSFGINVARLARLPREVRARAASELQWLYLSAIRLPYFGRIIHF